MFEGGVGGLYNIYIPNPCNGGTDHDPPPPPAHLSLGGGGGGGAVKTGLI